MDTSFTDNDVFYDNIEQEQPYYNEEEHYDAKPDPFNDYYNSGDKSTKSFSDENIAKDVIPFIESGNWTGHLVQEKPHQYHSGETNYSSEPLTFDELFGNHCIFCTDTCMCSIEPQVVIPEYVAPPPIAPSSKLIGRIKPVKTVKTTVNRTKKNIKNSMKNLTIDSCHSLESHIYRGLVEAICKKTGCATQKFLMFAEALRLNMKQFGFPVMRKLWAGSAMQIDESTLKNKSALRGFEKDYPVLGEAYLSWMKIYLKKIAVQRTYRSKVRGSGESMVASYQHMSRCMRDINLLTRHVPLLSNWN